MKRGYIRLYRKIEDWSWYDDSNTFRVFIFLLIHANFQDKLFLDTIIKRGSLATSYQTIAGRLNLTYKQVRTAIEHLKKTKNVSVSRLGNYLVITIINYDMYQSDKADLKALKRQSKGNQRAIKGQQLNNYNNDNNDNRNYSNNKDHSFGYEGAAYNLKAYEEYCFLDDPNSKCNIMLREEKTKRNE